MPVKDITPTLSNMRENKWSKCQHTASMINPKKCLSNKLHNELASKMKDFRGKIVVILTSSGVPSLYPLVMLSCEWLKSAQRWVCVETRQSVQRKQCGRRGEILALGSPLPYNSPLFCQMKSHKPLSIKCFYLPFNLSWHLWEFLSVTEEDMLFNEWNLPLACHSQSYAVLVVGWRFWRDFSPNGRHIWALYHIFLHGRLLA